MSTYVNAENMAFMATAGPFNSVTVNDLQTTIQVTNSNGTISFRDNTGATKSYQLLQLHFHSPAEHTFGGKLYDLELHLVHKNSNASELTVLAIFFDRKYGGNKPSPFLDSLNLNSSL
jgi:carbonic anhydrase